MGKPILHAQALKAWADGQEIQYQMSCNPSEVWGDVTVNHNLVIFDSAQYKLRIKPRTIKINGFEVPEPVREPLKEGQVFWAINVFDKGGVFLETWDSGDQDLAALENGCIHLTKEAAELHARALLSFTAKQGE